MVFYSPAKMGHRPSQSPVHRLNLLTADEMMGCHNAVWEIPSLEVAWKNHSGGLSGQKITVAVEGIFPVLADRTIALALVLFLPEAKRLVFEILQDDHVGMQPRQPSRYLLITQPQRFEQWTLVRISAAALYEFQGDVHDLLHIRETAAMLYFWLCAHWRVPVPCSVNLLLS